VRQIFDLTSGWDEEGTLSIVAYDRAGNASETYEAALPPNPASYTPTLSTIKYRSGSGVPANGYVAELGIPKGSITQGDASGQNLVIHRCVAVPGAGTIEGFGTGSPTVGKDRGRRLGGRRRRYTAAGREGWAYILTDVMPAGPTYAHGTVRYSFALEWNGSHYGDYGSVGSRTIEDTPPDFAFTVRDGGGKELRAIRDRMRET
jgi:hypothetical protein